MRFLITEDENRDSVLFFTALLRCEQYLKRCFFSNILKCFCKPLIVISTWRVGHTFGLVLVMQEENLDFVMFFTAFWSRGDLSKR